MPLTLRERDEEPSFAYRLFILTLLIDAAIEARVFWYTYQLPSNDFRLGLFQIRVLWGVFFYMLLPVATLFLLLAERPLISFLYAFLKLLSTLRLAAQLCTISLLGQLSCTACAHVGWNASATLVAVVYVCRKFTFRDLSITSSKLTLAEEIAVLEKMKEQGTLSQERFENLRDNLLARDERDSAG
ncbi:MAG TPA: hypothetical protein VMV72_05695 [Verrucomicrobiae bacterium]|nr:hypothetical protein [Verrucomicrobiae bacterium]